MKPLRAIAREDGIAVVTATMVMGVLLGLGGTAIVAATSSNSGTNRDELSGRAFQAAEAGVQTGLHRLNMSQPQPEQCVTTTVAAPDTNGWCAATAVESLGHGQYFTYRVSAEGSTCTGTTLGPAVVERCIVATGWGGGAPGTAGAVSRRVIVRASAFSGASPFPVAGILGTDGISIANNARLLGDAGTNGQLSVANNSTLTGTAYLWTGAPNPTGSVTAVVRGPKFVLSPPSPLNPGTRLDGSASNDNGRLALGAVPPDPCIGGSGTGGGCYTNTATSPRTLALANSGQVTLGGGYYNFCQLNLGNQSAVNIAAGAQVMIFLDSPDRAGSGCVAGQGNLVTGNGTSMSNPSGDPKALQIVVYGSAAGSTISIPNKNQLAAAIYAPTTVVSFQNTSSFIGGITAKEVILKNNATWDTRLEDFQLATTLVFYRSAWHECTVLGGSAAVPADGCS